MQSHYSFYSPLEIQNFFSKSSANPQKKWGQNFLIDPNIVRKILQVAKQEEILKSEIVAEIGAGLGALTHEIVKFKKPLCIFEIDPLLTDFLSKQSYLHEIDVQIIRGDVLENLHILEKSSVYFFGNLPYYISSEILTSLFKRLKKILGGVFLLQKEFVFRITQETSSLSIFLNAFGKWRREFVVSKNCFYPKPNVDSAVLSFSPHEKEIFDISKIQTLELVLRGMFWGKRKTISKIIEESPFFENLDKLKLKYILFEVLQKTVKERPEELEFQDYYKIAELL
ncbi:MAG: 16S rRNA (adenine(1518)-N(6)/adenine(1519)-N(6))-dimethyltransferase RsmA [Leptospiraceae bacterium]|nr:16S rRNA (adenine(1518)-N(6)/adenine(1519)-N(6))-dimethyltransferase RsmA [Leptospiraceae bacterium]